jgi:hypothetical protein
VDNVNVRLMGHLLLRALMEDEEKGAAELLKLSGELNQKYYLFPFLYANHASLLIFAPFKQKAYHVDSFLVAKQHISLLHKKLKTFFH